MGKATIRSNFKIALQNLIRLGFANPPSPNGEGYSNVRFVLENIGITNHLNQTLLSDVSDVSTTLRFATSCDHLRWAGKMTAQKLSRAFSCKKALLYYSHHLSKS
jgi:hypothetical protein